MGTCTVCANNGSSAYEYAERYIRRAQRLLEDDRLDDDQINKLESTLEKLNAAMINADIDAVQSYSRTLRSYYYSISDSLK